MSDSSKSRSIPAWQRRANSSTDQSTTESPSSSPSSDDAPAPTSREDLVYQASRFLEDESIRDSPTDQKVAFLESKGLNSEEIQQLLGVSRNLEATSSSASSAEDSADNTPETSSTSSDETTGATPSSTATEQSQSQSQSPPSSQSAMSPPRAPATSTSPQAVRNEPPIITYPEFLMEASKPPPLVTMQGILYTIYGAAGLGASIYGASEFLVKPMVASLSSARHELAETAQANLKKFNEKLEQTVSVIPPHLTAPKEKYSDEEEKDSDSVTSDPTELFHRDIGTQTTPDVSSSSTSLESTSKDETPAPSAAVATHMTRLESIQSQLREINDVEKEAGSLDDTLRSSLSDLHHYLDGLMYSTPSYTAAGSYGLYSGSTPGTDSSSSGSRKAEDDAIASFKAEIRGVKGALLSARNFPSGRTRRRPGYPS